MQQDLQIYSLSTGSLIIATDKEALLMGGGLPVVRLKEELSKFQNRLTGILIPNEHSHRIRGLYDLAVDWSLPLIGHWRIIVHELFHRDNIHIPSQVLTDFDHHEWQCGGFHLSMFPVKYDSICPCGWQINTNGKKLGVVLDGRLNDFSLQILKECDALVLNNCRNIDSNRTDIPAKRIRSVYPTTAEQSAQLKQAEIAIPEFPVLPLKSYPIFSEFQKGNAAVDFETFFQNHSGQSQRRG